jgi:hypothetical protein
VPRDRVVGYHGLTTGFVVLVAVTRRVKRNILGPELVVLLGRIAIAQLGRPGAATVSFCGIRSYAPSQPVRPLACWCMQAAHPRGASSTKMVRSITVVSP